MPGRVALAALCATYALLAALPASSGSKLVLATAGGSPDWLLGPLQPFVSTYEFYGQVQWLPYRYFSFVE